MRIAILAPVPPSGEQGGAERFYRGLRDALSKAGADPEIVEVVSDERDFAHVQESCLRFYDLDLSWYDAVISTKAPAYLVRHPNHVCYLQHTMRVFYDMFDAEFPNPTDDLIAQRRLIQQLDSKALQPPWTRAVFTISQEVSDRLETFNGIESRVLYQASTIPGLRRGDYRYIFMPGRLHRWKRVDLVVSAMAFVRARVELVISGTGEDEAAFRALALGDSRIRFVGRVSDEELKELYADALAVAFVPIREDFGLVTLEAFNSAKPVITCADSGEPARLVQHERTGYICDPDPQDIARCIDAFADDPDLARRMGEEGAESIADVSWSAVADELMASLGRANVPGLPGEASARRPTSEGNVRIAVMDMQPIDPPVGGGRLRLLGLYHALGVLATYVGTFDWPGESPRDHWLSPTLREIDVPLSEEHHTAAKELSKKLAGVVVIDSAFHRFAHLSDDFHQTAVAEASNADVLVFSHPWIYPQLRDSIDRGRHLVVYDSHNVEGYLRYTLLDGASRGGAELSREVAQLEASLCREADIVLACSHRDRELFHDLYDIPFAKIFVVPNGVFTTRIRPATPDEKRRARARQELPDAGTALFLGSPYAPNVEAAEFIINALAPSVPDLTFVIAGGVGAELLDSPGIPGNVRITGQISEEQKLDYLQAVDLAINPMFSGSGTNIKMLEFMAAGLPIITTPIGARGLRSVQPPPYAKVDGDDMAAAIRDLHVDKAARIRLATAARAEAVEAYSWDRISAELGCLLLDHALNRYDVPFFSVVVPSFDRHDHLSALMECLANQTWRNFEIIVVDQSASLWADRDKDWNLNLRYFHTDVRGAVNARNRGAYYARGQVIAFVDDDCLPNAEWLASAKPYFLQAKVIGLEGLIISAERNNPAYRTVSNEGFPGMGFMTANLFIRREAFYALDGFDVAFDRPHFREDTDLGWRALAKGEIPFAEDVVVYHPPHPVTVERESVEARAEFFEKDALLFKKHPDRYRELFRAEGHWAKTPGFWDNFLRGHEKYGVEVDPFFLSFMRRRGVALPARL